MYVCSCNGITDHDIERAVQAGAKNPRDIYESAGCRAQCGRCTCTILEMLRCAGCPVAAIAQLAKHEQPMHTLAA